MAILFGLMCMAVCEHFEAYLVLNNNVMVRINDFDELLVGKGQILDHVPKIRKLVTVSLAVIYLFLVNVWNTFFN